MGEVLSSALWVPNPEGDDLPAVLVEEGGPAPDNLSKKDTEALREAGVLVDEETYNADVAQLNRGFGLSWNELQARSNIEAGVGPGGLNPDDYSRDELVQLAEDNDVEVASNATKAEIAVALSAAGVEPEQDD